MSTFFSWRRPQLLHESTQQPSGRLGRGLAVSLVDSTLPQKAAEASIDLAFRSAADIARLTERAIRHRAPAPGVPDAETTKCVHVDFHSPDLPWRYTPVGHPSGKPEQLRPWMALIVGKPDEITIAGAIVTISPRVLALACYQLTDSYRWAHVHGPDDDVPALSAPRNRQLGLAAPDRLSRLLSLRRLDPLTTYTAVIVPAFNGRGQDMWDTSGKITNAGRPLPLLSWWTFTTGEGGDFETLAAQLRVPPAADLGKAAVTYRAPGGPIGPVDVRGALQSLQAVQDQNAPELDLVAQQVALAARQSTSSPELLGLPDYGMPWVPAPEEHQSGWVARLRTDARVRIHAGTGAWTGVEAQDELMQAAVQQAGALPDAAALIARTAAGLATSGTHWSRALPADPGERLAVLGPLLTRLPAGTGHIVAADAISGPEHTLDRSLMTGAGQRLLGRSWRVDREPVASPVDLWRVLNEPEDPWPDGDLAARWRDALPPDGEAVHSELAGALANLRAEAARAHARYRVSVYPLVMAVLAEKTAGLDRSDALAVRNQVFEDYEQPQLTELTRRLADAARPLERLARHCGEGVYQRVARLSGDPDWNGVLERLVREAPAADLVYGSVQTAVLQCLLPECRRSLQSHADPESPCARTIALLRIPAPAGGIPIALPELGTNLVEAIDPRGAQPPAVRSLNEQIPAVLQGSLAPPRYPLGLDFPTWSLLRRYAPDWLLPGSQDVARHSITALRTNPVFIDAFLVGLNSQFLSEVRWRGLQVDRWGTPLRMFFAPVDARTGDRVPEIIPIEKWPAASDLGSAAHQTASTLIDGPDGPDGTDGAVERLVILFNTPLFRRYPRTVVYLHRATGDDELDELSLAEDPELTPGRRPTGEELSDDELHAWYRTRRQIAPAFTGTITPELVFFVFDVPPGDLNRYYLVLDEPASELRFRNDKDHAKDSSAEVAGATVDRRTRVVISGRDLSEQGMTPQ